MGKYCDMCGEKTDTLEFVMPSAEKRLRRYDLCEQCREELINLIEKRGDKNGAIL